MLVSNTKLSYRKEIVHQLHTQYIKRCL